MIVSVTFGQYYNGEQAGNKKGYWINELESLGISSQRINNYLDNNHSSDEKQSIISELADLVENIKQMMYQQYKTAYSERMVELEEVAKERVIEQQYVAAL
jgi:hypothetical protein